MVPNTPHKLTDKELAKLEKDILAGKYKDCYIRYGRRSDKDPNSQKNSLPFQNKQTLREARDRTLPVVEFTIPGFCTDGFIGEKHSGFEEEDEFIMNADGSATVTISRPKFRRMMGYLSRRLFKGVIVLCYDRISRNSTDGALVKKLIRQGVDVRFVWANYEKNASGSMHMNADQMFAQHHAELTSEKVSETFEEVRSKGKVTNRAPVGYLNEGNMDWKPQDPKRAPLIKRMFELCDEDWSLSDIANWAKEAGFTMCPMRRKRTEEEMLMDEDDEDMYFKNTPKIERLVTPTGVHKILTNPFYKGQTRGPNKEWITSTSHEAIVSVELFDRIQEKLKKRKVSVRYAQKLALAHRGLVRCSGCGRVYTPYIKKGIHYFYSRCPKNCVNEVRSVNIDFLQNAIGNVLKKLVFTEDEKAEIDAKTSTEIAVMEDKRQVELAQIERRKKKLREDLAYIGTNKLVLLRTGTYLPEELKAEERKLSEELATLAEKEAESDKAMSVVVQQAIRLSELLDDVYFVYDSAEPEEKEMIIRRIFSELTLANNVLHFKCKNSFRALEERFSPTCDPTGNRTPLSSVRGMCPSR